MAVYVQAAQRPKVFVSYHHHGDGGYYSSLSEIFHDRYQIIRDESIDRKLDSDNDDYMARYIREEHIHGTSCTLLLVGAATWGRKHVDWELHATLAKQHGLVGIGLGTATHSPDRFVDNWKTGYAVWTTWEMIFKGSNLAVAIADANGRSRSLINNSRPQRQRNA